MCYDPEPVSCSLSTRKRASVRPVAVRRRLVLEKQVQRYRLPGLDVLDAVEQVGLALAQVVIEKGAVDEGERRPVEAVWFRRVSGWLARSKAADSRASEKTARKSLSWGW